MRIFFDGGCTPNPGQMEVAVVWDDFGEQHRYHQMLDHGTSIQAEWLALLWAMDLALEHQLRKPTFIGDCAVVINQALGIWKVAPHLASFHAECRRLREHFDQFAVHQVRRKGNLAGHHISRQQKARKNRQKLKQWQNNEN